MANKINVKLILQLLDAGLSGNRIASTRHISKHSIGEVKRIAEERHIHYEDVKELSDAEAYSMFFPDRFAIETLFRDPDYEYIHKELKKAGVTLKLLWQEYQEKCHAENATPMGYTKFCEGYGQYITKQKLTNCIEHKPGERVEVDWSGPTMHYIDPATGEAVKVYLFVGTLPYSQYSYVEACPDMKMDSFLKSHVNMYEYFEGVPTRTICDNLKTGVVKHPKEGDIILTADYEALGLYYATAIMPAGVRKPKQKASVEGTVGKIATAIIASLRNREFHSLAELKKAVKTKLDAFNQQSFQKRDGSRYLAWQEEKEYLHPLPAIPYEIAHWDYGHKVGLNWHVIFQKNLYSCPYQYAKKLIDIRYTDTTVELYYKDERISTHQRFPSHVTNKYSTHPEDMPREFQNISRWDDERIRKWAKSLGPYTAKVIDIIFENVSIKEQGYNPALSVLRLSKAYSDARLEVACEIAIKRGIRSPRYHHLKAILSADQDVLYIQDKITQAAASNATGFLRGTSYYKNGGSNNDQ